MNIVVCVKYVPDAQAERTFNASDNTTDRESVDGLLSELDEYAVEEALKIVEAGEGEVTVLTVGPDAAADAIKKALQMGAHKGVHVNDDAIHGSDAVATSLVLAEAVKKIGDVDLVVTGMASTDGTMGVVPAMLAERLGPARSDVRLRADRRGEHGHDPSRRRRLDADHHGHAAGRSCRSPTRSTSRATPRSRGSWRRRRSRSSSGRLADLGVDASQVGLDAAWTKVESFAARPPRSQGEIVADEGDGGSKLAAFLSERKFV